jgi:hypothetical protein
MDEEIVGGCDNKIQTHIAHVVIIVLLMFIIWKLSGLEHLSDGYYTGSGLNDQVYTSGADQRFYGQVFSSTDQG